MKSHLHKSTVICIAFLYLWWIREYLPNGGERLSLRTAFTGGEFLQSFRFEVTGERSHRENVFTARQLIVPANEPVRKYEDALLGELQELLPKGTYTVKRSLTGCFHNQWLRTDIDPRSPTSALRAHTHASRCPLSKQRHVRKLVANGSSEVRAECGQISDIFKFGYWTDNGWESHQCGVQFTGGTFREQNIFIHIAGDSVARGMLDSLCKKIDATKHHTIVDSDQRVKYRHCCDEGLSSCVIFRMSWYPLQNFSPNYVTEYWQTKETYCRESHDVLGCVSTVADAAFNLRATLNQSQVWHWLFIGSHSPGVGASSETCLKFKELSSSRENIIFFGTPAINEELIPGKYASQRGLRTNARIFALNKMLANCTSTKSFADLFTVTFSRRSSDFADAIHFKLPASDALSEVIWHSHLAAKHLSSKP
jgi:hypothetical protein